MVENADDRCLAFTCEIFIDNDDSDGFLLDDETWFDKCDELNCVVVMGGIKTCYGFYNSAEFAREFVLSREYMFTKGFFSFNV